MSYDDVDRPGMREAWQVTDWRKRAAELEEEVKLLREREKLLEAVAEAAKRRELASRGIDNGPERVTADILLWNELETLAAYDARKGTDEVPKVR